MMGRAANRKWAQRARHYHGATLRGRSILRAMFEHKAKWRLAILAGLALLVLAHPAAGQTPDLCTGPADATVCVGPIPSSARLSFVAPSNILTSTGANAMEPRVYVDGSTTAFHALAEVCTGAAAPFACVAPVPPGLLAVLNVAGLHSVTVKLFDPSTGTEGPSAVPFVLKSPPGAPTGLRIVP